MLYSGHVYIGLTGGIGSGKSTVAQIFAELGAVVVDADELARGVLAPGEPLVEVVEKQFGPGLVNNGVLNREALGKKIFADSELRIALERLVHPEVVKRLAAIRDDVSADDVLIYDVPLLTEKSMESQFDAVVVVHSPLEERLERLERRGLARPEAEARISHQASDDERMAVATYVIDNSGSIDELRDKCQTVWQAITA